MTPVVLDIAANLIMRWRLVSLDILGKPVRWWVMIENPQGNITMSTSTFSRFAVEKKFLHPDAAKISEFSFTSKYPNGTVADFAVAISPVPSYY